MDFSVSGKNIHRTIDRFDPRIQLILAATLRRDNILLHEMQADLAPKQEESQYWKRIINVLVAKGDISEAEGILILECWHVADRKDKDKQKKFLSFLFILRQKFGDWKGFTLHTKLLSSRSKLLEKIRQEKSSTTSWEPSTVARILMDNCVEQLESLRTDGLKADVLQDVLSIGWDYPTAADEQKLFAVPVLDADVPGYSQTKVMALSMMNAKLYHRQYGSLDSFADDVYLMLKNYGKYSSFPEGAKKVAAQLWATWRVFYTVALAKLAPSPNIKQGAVGGEDSAPSPAHKKQKLAPSDTEDVENHENCARNAEEVTLSPVDDVPSIVPPV